MDPKDLKPGQSIREMGGSQPDCSRELRTGQCIGDLRKDEPTRPARKHPSEMQPGEIKRHYQKLSEKSSKLVDRLIEAGFGSVKSSEMRERRSEHPLFEAYVSNLDQMGELKAEAERRYGPGLASVSHLSRIHGPLKKAGDLDKGDLVDLKTKKVLSTTPTVSTPKETQPLVEDGKKKIVNRQYLRDNFKPTKPNRTKLEGDDKAPGVKKTEQLKKQLNERIDLLKAKIIDFKSRKVLAETPTTGRTPRDMAVHENKRGNATFISPKSDERFDAAVSGQAAPKTEFTHGEMIDKLRARFNPKTDKSILSYIDAHQKLGHDEPYVGGATDNVTWRTVEAEKNPKLRHKARWNEPMPFPVHPDKVEHGGTIGKRVGRGGNDPLAWMDSKYGIAKETIRRSKDQPLAIHTRSDLIARTDYMEHLGPKHHVYVHLSGSGPYTTGSEISERHLEPGAPSNQRRLQAVKRLKEAGHKVTIVHDKWEHPNLHPDIKRFNQLNEIEMARNEGVKGVPIETNRVQLTDRGLERMHRAIGEPNTFTPRRLGDEKSKK
jgi:hypothetical protein